jgi:hypothetical protein
LAYKYYSRKTFGKRPEFGQCPELGYFTVSVVNVWANLVTFYQEDKSPFLSLSKLLGFNGRVLYYCTVNKNGNKNDWMAGMCLTNGEALHAQLLHEDFAVLRPFLGVRPHLPNLSTL